MLMMVTAISKGTPIPTTTMSMANTMTMRTRPQTHTAPKLAKRGITTSRKCSTFLVALSLSINADP